MSTDGVAKTGEEVEADVPTVETLAAADVPPPPDRRVAVLDENGVLTGSKIVAHDAPGIDFGDLPTKGTYKWVENPDLPEGGQFIPLGHGFGKIAVSPPFTNEHIMAVMVDALERIDAAPLEAIQWRDWYNQTLRQRDEEVASARRK